MSSLTIFLPTPLGAHEVLSVVCSVEATTAKAMQLRTATGVCWIPRAALTNKVAERGCEQADLAGWFYKKLDQRQKDTLIKSCERFV